MSANYRLKRLDNQRCWLCKRWGGQGYDCGFELRLRIVVATFIFKKCGGRAYVVPPLNQGGESNGTKQQRETV